MSTDDQDGTYEACLAYLNAKGHVLWGDYSLNPNRNDDGTPKNHAAARWLEAQVRGVADHYDTPTRAYELPRTLTNEAQYRPNLKSRPRPRPRPSALITHGQQPERW